MAEGSIIDYRKQGQKQRDLSEVKGGILGQGNSRGRGRGGWVRPVRFGNEADKMTAHPSTFTLLVTQSSPRALPRYTIERKRGREGSRSNRPY